MKVAHSEARDAFKLWILSRKPRQGDVFQSMKQSRLLLLNACVRVADVMIFTFVSLMPVHNVCRICMIIKQ